jgi:hypothetical protein
MRLADEIGYTFPEHEWDRRVPGRYHASHAETQMAALARISQLGYLMQCALYTRGSSGN